ncbi:site-specific DNA-methyltransferase [Patescibacteria group bacterium]|uniref:Putative methyltransferase n=1 Tax=viral metagenome TaxID=1070528 RepID=A0A6M3IUH8_9ZZZZ|nr:site-specific DNA-methyltransferase [Patescibacteria group bacterium]
MSLAINADNFDVFSQLDDNSIDLIITDPPYKDYQSQRPSAHEKVEAIVEADFDLPYFLEQSARVLKPGSHLYCWCDHLNFPRIYQELDFLKQKAMALNFTSYLNYKNLLVWVKNNHGSGDLFGNYAPQHELVIFACKGKGRRLNGTRPPNVFFKTDGDRIEFYKKVSNYAFGHGTSKPVDIQQLMIRTSSEPNELVFDPYAGSMSVGEACLLEGRSYLMVEINKQHFETGIKRLTDIETRLNNA